jgi:membrane protease YdiL (CAAX protease family)
MAYPALREDRSPSLRVALLGAAYAIVGLLGAALSLAWGESPLAREPWLDTQGGEALVASLVLGASTAGVTVLATRWLVRRARWARSLHATLRPLVRDASLGALLAMALASGVAEELLFRGFLFPHVGLLVSSLAFGALHQLRGPGRMAWVLWASLMGAVFALLYGLTGRLEGPILAHVAINAANLRYLRDHDPGPLASAGLRAARR